MQERRARLGLDGLAAMPIRRAPHAPLLPRVWELRYLTSYDAVYVALAEALDVVLITGNGRIARAGHLRCPIEFVKP